MGQMQRACGLAGLQCAIGGLRILQRFGWNGL
jgi:hypothetical protein